MPNYCTINSENRRHLITLIKWLFDEVISAGGDGDGIWYSKFFAVNDIKTLMIEEKLIPKDWLFTIESKDTFIISGWQDYLMVTNNKTDFAGRPTSQQVSLVY